MFLFFSHLNFLQQLVRAHLCTFNFNRFIHNTAICTSSMIIKRKIIKGVEFTDTKICEEDFFGIKPVNLYHHEQELEQIRRYLTMMTRFNVWIDALLERKNQFFVIKNTRIQSQF